MPTLTMVLPSHKRPCMKILLPGESRKWESHSGLLVLGFQAEGECDGGGACGCRGWEGALCLCPPTHNFPSPSHTGQARG